MKSILVLMSTYNGQRFLKEQIDSILSQRGVDVHLLVRDDGSSDSTPEILSAYQERYPNVEVLLEENIGCKYSFAKLCRIALERYPDYDYYAFSDQDDVWMEDKLSSATFKLNGQNSNSGRLYLSEKQIVDAALSPLSTPKRNYRLTLGESFIMHFATGCTMVFDINLLKMFCFADPSLMTLHDEWMYKMCLAIGGEVCYDSTPHILYRQHGNNVVGVNLTFRQRWNGRWIRYAKEPQERSKLLTNMQSIYKEYFTLEARRIFGDITTYELSLRSKLRVLFSSNIKSNYWKNNFGFFISVLTNRF